MHRRVLVVSVLTRIDGEVFADELGFLSDPVALRRAERGEMSEDVETLDDALSPARGVLIGVALSVPLWVLTILGAGVVVRSIV